MSRYLFDTQRGDALLVQGTFTLNGSSAVTVSNLPINTGATIEFGLKTVGGTVGALPAIQTITPSTAGSKPGPQGVPAFNGSFTVAGTAGDTSVYNYRLWP